MRGKEQGQQMEQIEFKPKVGSEGSYGRLYVPRFPLFPWFSCYFGDAYEWSTLKLMMDIVQDGKHNSSYYYCITTRNTSSTRKKSSQTKSRGGGSIMLRRYTSYRLTRLYIKQLSLPSSSHLLRLFSNVGGNCFRHPAPRRTGKRRAHSDER